MSASQGTPDSPLAGTFNFRIVIEGQVTAQTKEQVTDWMTAHFNMSLMAGQHVTAVRYGAEEVKNDDPLNIMNRRRPT